MYTIQGFEIGLLPCLELYELGLHFFQIEYSLILGMYLDRSQNASFFSTV
jgi:hypothetical protein